MKYTKAAFSYTEQLELLISRKLTCDDRDRALKWLQRVGYYRLSAYFLPFRIPGTNDFQPRGFAEALELAIENGPAVLQFLIA
jgi:abortive infection bacteriophage resistance protein